MFINRFSLISCFVSRNIALDKTQIGITEMVTITTKEKKKSTNTFTRIGDDSARLLMFLEPDSTPTINSR